MSLTGNRYLTGKRHALYSLLNYVRTEFPEVFVDLAETRYSDTEVILISSMNEGWVWKILDQARTLGLSIN